MSLVTSLAFPKYLGKANEVTKDTHRSTNINVESQTIEYLTNPGKLKEDIGKAKKEISDVTTAIKESINDRGDDNRNFFGQLSEVRLNKSLENITSERLIGKTADTEIAGIFKDVYKDLGYDINIIFSDPKNSPQLLDEKGLQMSTFLKNTRMTIQLSVFSQMGRIIPMLILEKMWGIKLQMVQLQ